MDKVFRVELFGEKTNRWCELELPSTYYGLLDALDKLQMTLGEKPRWEFLEHHGFVFLQDHLAHECDLYQLNALATCLGQMNGREKTAFEGLFNMEVAKKYGPISVATMIDLAYSTDCCHVVNASTDEQLGRFYAENDFIPALDKVPDPIFEYLDFEKLGRNARFEEGGVFANGGYVTQHNELKQVYDSLALIPEAPEYGIRLTVGKCPSHSDEQPDNRMCLDLPATQERLDAVLEAYGGASWSEMYVQVEDSAMPALLESMDCNDVHELNELAKCFKEMVAQGDLSTYKAVILAADCHDIAAAVRIAENLDDYLIEPDQRTPEEVAVEELRFIVDEHSRSILQKHIVLYSYGKDVMASNNALLTPYGLVQRRDGEPIRSEEMQAEKAGMEMM